MRRALTGEARFLFGSATVSLTPVTASTITNVLSFVPSTTLL